MEEDKIYKLNGEVQAVKQEVKSGFVAIGAKFDEMKDVFSKHITDDKEQDVAIDSIQQRLSKIELRVGLAVGVIVLGGEVVVKWVVSHIGNILN